MFSGLYINPANQAHPHPVVRTGRTQGCYMFVFSYFRTSNILFCETMRPRTNIFSMWQCLVDPYINPANYAPGVQAGQAPVCVCVVGGVIYSYKTI